MMSFYGQSNMSKAGPVNACDKHPVIAISVLQAQDGVGRGHGWEEDTQGGRTFHHVHGSERAKQSEGDLTEDVCTQSMIPIGSVQDSHHYITFFFFWLKNKWK